LRFVIAPALLLLGLGGYGSPAAAYCATSDRKVLFVEFARGSAALANTVTERLNAQLLPEISQGRYIASYYILASGDLAEGSVWESAGTAERLADRKLGEARSASIKAMLEAQPGSLRSKTIEVKIRDNRQVLTEQELQANPLLNVRVRAGIVADVRMRAPKRRKGSPVPVC
jgi:hypothetical protein